jgi:hypothetical protein
LLDYERIAHFLPPPLGALYRAFIKTLAVLPGKFRMTLKSVLQPFPQCQPLFDFLLHESAHFDVILHDATNLLQALQWIYTAASAVSDILPEVVNSYFVDPTAVVESIAIDNFEVRASDVEAALLSDLTMHPGRQFNLLPFQPRPQ